MSAVHSPASSQSDDRARLVAHLESLAKEIRKDIVRLAGWGGSGHFGGSLSMTDILTVLYFHTLRLDPANPDDPSRDRFILSKGHGSMGYYPVLARAGFFSHDELRQYNHAASHLGMHLARGTPGVEMTAGSLGHGLSVAVGIALARTLNGNPGKVYCLLGDGELNEGSVWEAVMSASHFRLGNLIAIVDRNRYQQDGHTESTLALEPLAAKWRAFGWTATEIDGHDIPSLIDVLDAFAAAETPIAPAVVIAQTIKGKGVGFMEGQAGWHYGGLDEEDEKRVLAELDRRRDADA